MTDGTRHQPPNARRLGLAAAATLALCALAVLGATRRDDPPQPRFMLLDVYVDAGATPIAAYQVQVADAHADDANPPADVALFTLVGVEGGEHHAFKDPPYYDPAALAHRVIKVAALSTADDLPVGRTRLARLHVQVTGPGIPEARCTLEAAGNAAGTRIDADATVQFVDAK